MPILVTLIAFLSFTNKSRKLKQFWIPETAPDSRLRDLQLGDAKEDHGRNSVGRDDKDHRRKVEDSRAAHQGVLRVQGRGHQRGWKQKVPESFDPDSTTSAAAPDATTASTKAANSSSSPTAATSNSWASLSWWLPLTWAQSYKGPMIVNYGCRVIIWGIFN